IDNPTYGIAVQADGVQLNQPVAINSGTNGSLFGGILFQSKNGTCSSPRVENPAGIGIDMGGISNCTVANASIAPSANTEIGINAGASQNCKILHPHIASGASVAILASGYDGADNDNWFPNVGRNLTIVGADITLDGAGDRGIRFLNGFEAPEVRNCVFHVLSASGRELDFGSADRWVSEGNRVIQEANADETQHTNEIIIASATNIVIPDHADKITISGTTQIDNIQYDATNDQVGKVRTVQAVVGSEGSGYTNQTTVTASGGGATTQATLQAVRSNQQVFGAYVLDGGSGYTSAPTITVTDSGGGTGANLVASIGPGFFPERKILLRFQNSASLKSGASNLFLNSDFTASAFGISTIELLSAFSNFLEVGR
ncbi:MAG: hypothetical protein AAFW66_03105, partial [Pseudomonadota bacterium]